MTWSTHRHWRSGQMCGAVRTCRLVLIAVAFTLLSTNKTHQHSGFVVASTRQPQRAPPTVSHGGEVGWRCFSPSVVRKDRGGSARPRGVAMHATGAGDTPSKMSVGASTSVPKFAGALKASIYTHGQAEVTCVGDNAVNTALKSIGLAAKYIQEDGAGDKALAAAVKKTVVQGKEGDDLTAYVLTVREVEAPPTEISEPDLRISRSDVLLEFAGKLTDNLKEKSHVTITGMGPRAIGGAVSAMVMASSSGKLGLPADEALTLVPWQETVQIDNEERRRVVMYLKPRPGFVTA